MWFGGPAQALAGNPDQIRRSNDGIMALAATNRKIIPVATVHPYDGDAAIKEVNRVAARGVKILKLHAHTQKFDVADQRVLTLVKAAGARQMIILMDNASILPGDNEKLFNLAVAAPDTRFVFAHMGAMNFRFWNILALARTADGFAMPNVWFDLSATVLLAADTPIEEEFVWTVRNVGVERVLLGSDYPQMSLDQTLDALEKVDFTPAEKAQIRYGNAAKLFGLDGGQ
ncbi:MAG: amidohydrolase family protein [Sphingomonadaceae bacterium]|nr:amidohydrolase family protein [Sphingomonadaceae bacterium]